MLNFIDSDKKEINTAYKTILYNLKDYLQQYNVKSDLEYSKIILSMLHSGFFSISGTIQLNDNYNYLELPIEISQGVQVMYGICCCRHAAAFLYDLLYILNFHPSLIYFWVDNKTGIWRRVNPKVEKANHQAISSSKEDEYIIDPANKFISKTQKNGQLKLLDTECLENFQSYQEDNIMVVAKVLKKYYTYRELGIERVY